MEEALGDKFIFLAIVLLVIVWMLGWVILLIGMLLQMLIPRLDSRIETIFRAMGKIIDPIQKYALVTVAILFLIRFLAGLLGWAPPL